MYHSTITPEVLAQLKSHPCIKKITNKHITFTSAFKQSLLENYEQGQSPQSSFMNAGFDLSLWRPDYPRECLKRWRKIVKKRGIAGLSSRKGGNTLGRPKTKNVTPEDRIKYLELKVQYLTLENAFLAKLRARKTE